MLNCWRVWAVSFSIAGVEGKVYSSRSEAALRRLCALTRESALWSRMAFMIVVLRPLTVPASSIEWSPMKRETLLLQTTN